MDIIIQTNTKASFTTQLCCSDFPKLLLNFSKCTTFRVPDMDLQRRIQDLNRSVWIPTHLKLNSNR
uniref:Putative ovule protein n=1 Tax=Solanum chacoense TaxID=4108 RepID=A0A0V0GU77_SOLCH